MKKSIILTVCLIAVMVAVVGGFALPNENEPEKIVFVNVDESVDGYEEEVLTGVRVEDQAVFSVRIEEPEIEVQENVNESVDGFTPDVLENEETPRLPKCD